MTDPSSAHTPPPTAPIPGQPTTAVIPITPTGPIIPVITPTLTYVQKVFIAVGVCAAAVLLAILVYYTAEILVLIFAGLLLAVFIAAPSDLLATHARIKRTYALLIVLATLFVIVVGGGSLMGNTVYNQTRQIYRDSKRAFTQVDLSRYFPKPTPATLPDAPPETAPATLPTTDPTTLPTTQPNAMASDDPADWVAEHVRQFRQTAYDFLFNESIVRRAGGYAGSFITSTFGIIGNFVIVFGVGLFFAINPGLYVQGLIRLFPMSHRGRTATILSQVGTQLEWWFVGQLCSMASIGMLTFIGLKILGMPMALTLAIIAGLLNFIPNFGPFIAAAPAVLIAIAPHENQTQLNPSLAGWVVLLYIIIQLLEGWVITPFFQARAVELPPALIIISQVIFALLLGPIGLVLATPILATMIVLVRTIYIEDVLGDRPPPALPENTPPL